MNMDGEAHTVTADTGSAFDVKAAPGASTTFTAPTSPAPTRSTAPTTANMHGMLVVK